MEKHTTNHHKIIIILNLLIIILLAILVFEFYTAYEKKKTKQPTTTETDKKILNSAYHISGNSLEDFDLYFLQLENENKNKVYSPLSIKYALSMLKEGANGETKRQIANIIGEYDVKKYATNDNMSFANALFVKDSFKNSIKSSYADTISNQYSAEVIYDSFKSPNQLNSWISNKTFNLIPNMFTDISDKDFILVNALAIDMEWINKIQSEHIDYHVHFEHEKYFEYVPSLDTFGYHGLDFTDILNKVKSATISASINKYDIVNTIGEDSIRNTVGKEYEKWIAEGACGNPEAEPDTDTYLTQYIKELNSGYKQKNSSTDFSFYNDDTVKLFAKDLKEYDGTTLEYVAIMPKKDSLDNYIKNTKASDINSLITKIKPIELENFKEGIITRISGYIPMFQFDYELNLKADLNQLGITNVFDASKADLSNLSTESIFINDASHKANIEFSNDGIKAGAVTTLAGKGSSSCGFDYQYEVPVEEIDLTFDHPYLFLVMDKSTKEVWFIGTVYEPTEYQPQEHPNW